MGGMGLMRGIFPETLIIRVVPILSHGGVFYYHPRGCLQAISAGLAFLS
jgi:hypothetical protein